jgi:hypothetical protein
MTKINLALDKIVLLDDDEIEAVIEYLKKDLDDKEKEYNENAIRFYMNHFND